MKTTLSIFALAAALVAAPLHAQLRFADFSAPEIAKIAQVAQVKPHPRQVAWQQLELTAFIHFGVNTFTDREWGTGKEDPKVFNPTALDCRQWAKALKEAGFKLAILTAKHHDGFCLWPSKLTNHTVAASPWKDGKGDVCREFADACRAEGLKVGFYLSPWDRHEPSYGTDAYNDFFVGQLNELFDNYGPIDEIWFDGACGEGPNGKKQVYDWSRYYATIRARNPDCVIAVSGPDVRWVGNESGLARDSEWSVIPAEAVDNEAVRDGFAPFHFDGKDIAAMARRQLAQERPSANSLSLGSLDEAIGSHHCVWYPAECDVSIRPGWFWHASQDNQVKSLDKLMSIYDRSVGRNAVLLLNIPPTTQGLLHQNDVARLKEFGETIRKTFATNLLGPAVPDRTEVILDAPIRFDTLVAQEDITQGQVVERFHFEAKLPGQFGWQRIAGATTIGHKRILRLKEPIEATAVRLVIDETRARPHILSIGAYLAP